MNKIKIGDIVVGKVIFIANTHFLVELKNKIVALVHISEISDYFVAKITTMFKIGERHYFEVIEINKGNKVKLSWKKLKPRFLKEPFEFEIEATGKGFTLLKKNTERELEKNA